jgi:hypothetical protein
METSMRCQDVSLPPLGVILECRLLSPPVLNYYGSSSTLGLRSIPLLFSFFLQQVLPDAGPEFQHYLHSVANVEGKRNVVFGLTKILVSDVVSLT